MELLNKESLSTSIEKVYTIQHPTEGVLIYKEWIDIKSGDCVDFVLRSKHGYHIDDFYLTEEIQNFIEQCL